MWIILNPKKASRFTTKGINLHRSAPTAFVDPGIGLEVMTAINRAISDGRLIRVQGNTIDGMTIPQQAQIGSIDTEDTETVASTQCVRDEQGKITANVLVMPDRDGNVSDEPPKQRGIIITDIIDTPLDEDEDDGED